jgi:effector-binding domain-containing protein
MNYITNKLLLAGISILPLLLPACKGKDDETAKPKEPVKIKQDTSRLPLETNIKKPPIINIVDTVVIKQTVIYIKDSAASSERISKKLSDLFEKRIPELSKSQKFKILSSPMVWYKSQQAPFFFEAGVAIDKKPAKLTKPYLVKTIGGDSAVVAHFFGPYEITIMGYEALNDWMKSHKKKRTSPSYEIYVSNPYSPDAKKADPYKVQTDIVFPHK